MFWIFLVPALISAHVEWFRVFWSGIYLTAFIFYNILNPPNFKKNHHYFTNYYWPKKLYRKYITNCQIFLDIANCINYINVMDLPNHCFFLGCKIFQTWKRRKNLVFGINKYWKDLNNCHISIYSLSRFDSPDGNRPSLLW